MAPQGSWAAGPSDLGGAYESKVAVTAALADGCYNWATCQDPISMSKPTWTSRFHIWLLPALALVAGSARIDLKGHGDSHYLSSSSKHLP